jgi:hypothetical protein
MPYLQGVPQLKKGCPPLMYMQAIFSYWIIIAIEQHSTSEGYRMHEWKNFKGGLKECK